MFTQPRLRPKHDVVIVGGGIVGLACALQLINKRASLKILILEKENDIAMHQTGSNSGVVHSGIYYRPGSAKALNCVSGYKQLISFCQKEGVPYEICGKIIVATQEDQLPALEKLLNRGVANGLEGIKKISAAAIREREPHVAGIKGILVPQTGIIDFVSVARSYAKKLEEKGVEIKRGCLVQDIRRRNGCSEVIGGDEIYFAKALVSCAGLQADRLARKTEPDLSLRIVPFRGEYFTLREKKRSLVRSLIYPVPDPAFPFLGVHFTRMINGQVEAGPNAVLAFKREGYRKTDINLRDVGETLTWPGFHKIARRYWKTGLGEFYRSFSKNAFVTALRKLVPEIHSSDLQPGGAGVRAQVCDRNGLLLDDFYILEDEGVIHVCNAPSPAATASLAIGETVADKVLKILS